MASTDDIRDDLLFVIEYASLLYSHLKQDRPVEMLQLGQAARLQHLATLIYDNLKEKQT